MAEPPTLTVTIDPPAVISLAGELDLYGLNDVRRAYRRLTDDGPINVTIDMADLGFVDSSGLGVLIEIRGQQEQAGRSLTVREPSDRVRRLFSLTGLGFML